jgi:hypothetical protein
VAGWLTSGGFASLVNFNGGDRMPFVVKAAPSDVAETKSFSFHEKTMYWGKDICPRDDIFVFASDHQGGQGSVAKGIVTSVAHGPGIRVSIKVRRTAVARRNLGRRELKPFCDRDDDRPQTEIARKLYRQATNKIAGISDEAAAFLNTFF